MKKSVLAVAGAAIVALALTACSPISSGTVTGKEFHPSHNETITTCHLIGKVTICTPMTHRVDDKWQLDLTKGDKTGWVDVDKSTYDRTSVGDYFGSHK